MSSKHGSSASSSSPASAAAAPVEPRPLELSLNPVDGSLLTAPLSTVLLAATDGLYSDLYSMAQGEVEVTTAAPPREGADEDEGEEATGAEPAQTKRERMSNLSFAQRRHELTWRLVANGRAVQHAAALAAAAASTDLADAVSASSTALQHTRTAWVQADEAQDALFFFHALLFPARASPHDVYGAADLLLTGKWYDLPRDLLLTTDRYETSVESSWDRQETNQRWGLAVRNKLLTGEVGWNKRQQQEQPWKVSLRGGIVKFTAGTPKVIATDNGETTTQYPMEALLTVIPSASERALEWTLLSVEVRVQAKTGEFNHQLETTNRQRYDLHRLVATAMSREEARQRRRRTVAEEDGGTKEEPARPLAALFQVAHTFSLSWQLELLSAQAQALRRGVWAATAADGSTLTVVPVNFFAADRADQQLGVVSIHFWKVDDSYGPPCLGDLCLVEETDVAADGKKRTTKQSSNQLTLSIRAEIGEGMKVALSGAAGIGKELHSVLPTVRDLLDAASNPFALSASDALSAATRLCAVMKCQAAVEACDRSSVLPPWITLTVERGCIAVAAAVQYHGLEQTATPPKPVLFRIVCDARTGSFVNTFPRSMQLLRRLASNEVEASEAMALRIASLPDRRRRAAGANSSGRLVRDAWSGLIRSMNVLGERVGVGGSWDDLDDQSPLLRERSIRAACVDVKSALIQCCGMTALYGLTPLALASAVGLEALADRAGDAIEITDDIQLLRSPPVSILLDQELIETAKASSDGGSKKTFRIEQSLFSVACSVSEGGLTLVPLDVSVHLDSPTAVPERKSCRALLFKSSTVAGVDMNGDLSSPSPRKRSKRKTNGDSSKMPQTEDVFEEVCRFAEILADTIDSISENKA